MILARPASTHCRPVMNRRYAVVVGPTRVEHLEPVQEALSLELTSAELEHLRGLFA